MGVGVLAMFWAVSPVDLTPVSQDLAKLDWDRPPEAIRLALLGVGALLLYLSYSNQRLTAFSVGGMEATFTEVVARTLQDPKVPQQVKEDVEVIVTTHRAPAAAREAARESFSRRHQLALEFEDHVTDFLERQIGDQGWTSVERLPSGGQADIRIQVSPTSDVFIECRWSEHGLSLEDLDEWVWNAERRTSRTMGKGLVLVLAEASPASPMYGVVQWTKLQAIPATPQKRRLAKRGKESPSPAPARAHDRDLLREVHDAALSAPVRHPQPLST